MEQNYYRDHSFQSDRNRHLKHNVRHSIVASIPACHAGDQGSIPCDGDKTILHRVIIIPCAQFVHFVRALSSRGEFQKIVRTHFKIFYDDFFFFSYERYLLHGVCHYRLLIFG
jgi:hypothetical protein